MSTKYKMCDVSGVSLNNEKCAVIFLMKEHPQLFCFPVMGTYDEISGTVTLDNPSDFDLSYELALKNIQGLEDYEKEDHSCLFKYPFKNYNLKALVVHKEVFKSVSEIRSGAHSYADSIQESMVEGMKSFLRLEKMSISLREMALEITEKNPEIESSSFDMSENKYSEEASKLIKSFEDDLEMKDVYPMFDECRKAGSFHQIMLPFPPDQKLFNTLLAQSSDTTENIVNNFVNMAAFSVAFKSIVPKPNPTTVENVHHQPVAIDNHIEYYSKIIEALKKVREDD